MLVTKKINNNVAMAQDSQGREVIILGKGVGFPKTPYVLTDESRIEHAFYNVSSSTAQALENIRPEYLALCSSFADIAVQSLGTKLNPNMPLFLADHLQFAVERTQRGYSLSNPFLTDIQSVYPLGIIIDLISGILAPVIGLLATSGMIKGILAFCTWAGVLDPTSGTYLIWYAVGDAPMYFMPILLGITSARKFKMDEFVGACLGAALVYPTMVTMASTSATTPIGQVLGGTFLAMNVQSTFLGIPVIFPQSGYTSSIVPIILSVWVSSYVYRFFNTHIPNTVKLFLVPMLTLGIMGPLTFLAIGPVAALLTNIVSDIFNAILSIPAVGGIIEGTVLGAVWQILVIFGFHWAIIPIAIANIGMQGWDLVLAPQFGCTWAQIGVVLAILLRTHDDDLKDTAIASFITGIFGTTEPAIYGVTLPARKPFVLSCIAGAIGGFFLGLMKTYMFTAGYSGLLGLTSFIDARTAEQIAQSTLPYQGITSMIYAAIASVGCFIIGFVLCNVFYDPNKKAEEKAAA